MLFEDCLVCHDPPSARISPSKENLPPPCRSTAGWARAFAESKFETMHAHGGHTEGWFRQQCFAARPVRLQPVAASTGSSKQHARDTVKWLTMHDRGAHAALAQAKKFLLSAPRCCGLVTSRSQLRFVAVVGENDSLTFFFQAVTDRWAPAQFWSLFFTGSRCEEEGAEAHGPEDRPSAGRSSFFLLPWNCLQFVLKAFSFSRQALLACCCNTPGIHDKLAGNESDRARTAVHRPRTRWSRFWFWERIFSWTTHLITFVLRQATVGALLCDRMILLFSKNPQKMKKISSLSKQETENKKINEHSWSPFDCVTSQVTQQHSRRYFQLDLTMSCRESMLQLPATLGTRTAVPAICNHWTWRQNQSARNLNHFCRAPFRISGHFRWPITPLFFGIFLSFFHSMLSFHYLTSMHGKNLKVLCFKTAIWRTLSNFKTSWKRDCGSFFLPSIQWARCCERLFRKHSCNF